MSIEEKSIHIQYFALMREERGVGHETVTTKAKTARALFLELNQRHQFSLNSTRLNVAINESFAEWDTNLSDQDKIVFIPPVAGG